MTDNNCCDVPATEKPVEETQNRILTRLPQSWRENWELIVVGLTGLFFLAGWLGETVFSLPQELVLAFYLIAYAIGGYKISAQALPTLMKGRLDTDFLMVVAAVGAAVLGEWAEGAFLLFLFNLGIVGEGYAFERARRAISDLGQLMPQTALVKGAGNAAAEVTERPVDTLQVGEIVLVRPGDRIPVDGEIVNGRSAIDQSAITGESIPADKGPGDELFAGTVNRENALDVRVTKLAKDNTLNRVIRMVSEAQSQQSPTQRFTQRFSRVFVPAVLGLVGLVIVVPPIFDWMALEDSFYRGMLLLVAACPCALAIGTPAAVLSGIAQAARNGVMIKGGAHLENLGALKVMAFDKTGTLTEGRFVLTDVVALNGMGPDGLLRLVAGVEKQSAHPLAKAVVQAAQERQVGALPPTNGLENLDGRGVRSEVDGRPVTIGSLKLFRETAVVDAAAVDTAVVQAVERLEMAGKTTMVVNHDGRYLGVLALADAPRPGVQEVLRQLLSAGIGQLVMLSGDNQEAASEIGRQVGITDVRAGLLPEEKLAAIREMQDMHGPVAMIGDGVNDAPALATATVGIAMGGAGTAVALETADVALMADDLSRLPFAVGLSRASRAIIRQNVAIALGVILLLILTSVAGLIELSGAVILHEGSTMVVILNALRLLGHR